MKCSAALHFQRRPCVMSQHIDGRVIRRFISPPTLPFIRPLRPRTAHRPEHVPPENVRADILETQCGNVLVNAGFTVSFAVHPLPGPRRKDPLEHFQPADSDWIIKILSGAGAKAVNCDRETVNTYLRHMIAFSLVPMLAPLPP